MKVQDNILWFKQIHYEDVNVVGGKGANLGEMYNLGIPVPKSQADISTEECAALIEEYHMIAAENGVKLTESEPEITSKPEGYYREKKWHEMTREEQAQADPARFDEEMQMDIF